VVRKRRRWAMVLACLPALLVTPPAVAATASAGELLSGTVVHVATESGENHDAVDTFVQTADFDLKPVDDARVTDLDAGTEVELRVRDADAQDLQVLSVQDVAAAASTPAAVANASTPQTVRIAMAVPAGVAQDATPFTTAQVTTAVQQASDYWSSQTGGKVTFSVATLVPWYTSAVKCADYSALWNEAAGRTGFSYGPNEHLVVVTPARAYTSGACDAYGKGTIGDSLNSFGALYVTDVDSALWAHELGHNMGLGHANALYCASASDTPTSSTAGCGCPTCTAKRVSYGNVWDVMSYSGTTIGHGNLNVAGQDRLGVQTAGVQTVTASGTYSVAALPVTDSGVQGLKLVDPTTNGTYYVELRGSSAGDDLVASDWRKPAKGVLVTKVDDLETHASVVLDGTPTGNSSSDFDFAVPVGSTLHSASGKLHVEVLSANGATASVQVTIGDAEATPITVPTAPTGVVASASGTTASITWTPAGAGGGTVTEQTVTPFVDGVAQPGLAQVAAATATSTQISGLTPGTRYTFTVKAKNERGYGAESAASAPVLVPDRLAPTPAPVIEVPAAITLTAAGIADRSAWTTFTATAPAPGSRTLGYVVTAYRNGVAARVVQVPLTQNRAVVTGLVNGQSYTLGVKVRTTAGYGPETTTSALVPFTTPAQVTGVTARLTGEDRARLTWTIPANGGSDLAGYTVVTTKNGVAAAPVDVVPSELDVVRAGTAGPITVATDVEVEPGATYTYTVMATNAAGAGKASARTTLKVPALRAPSAVGAVKAALSYQSLALTWAAPAPGNRPIDGYTVSVRKNGGAPENTEVAGTTTTLAVDAASTYAITVTARSKIGVSPASRSVTVKVPAMTAPRAVTGLRGVLSGQTYTLTWGQPIDGNSPLTGYTVTQYVDGLPVSTRQVTDLTDRAATFTLTCGVSYSFTVAATNGVGTTTSPRTTVVKLRI
jgi:hypothetical protein